MIRPESRGKKYGRNYSVLVNYIFESIPEDKRDEYKKDFFKEFGNLSLEKRKKGDPVNSGCVHELDGLETIDLNDPLDLAKLVKESIHLMYQKDTAKRVLDGFLDNL